MPVVELRLGDMFDGPSDMIVVPCSTTGTITSFVEVRLAHHSIPRPNPGMALGDVDVMPFQGGENIAQYVAYAASVVYCSSSPDAILRIGQQIGLATKQEAGIRLVAAPLLGAGAGGLDAEEVVSALSSGFKSEAHPDAHLVIYVLQPHLYDRLSALSHQEALSRDTTPQDEPLRVFVSYCHTSDAHKEWVEQLAAFLRSSGIDARLDAWDLRPGMDMPQFMTNELALAKRVIIVSDEKYAGKADGRVGGVGWETMIVQGDMAKLPPESAKYLVVVRSSDLDAGLPPYLKTKLVIHWPGASADATNRQLLLRELYEQTLAPPIGPRPAFI